MNRLTIARKKWILIAIVIVFVIINFALFFSIMPYDAEISDISDRFSGLIEKEFLITLPNNAQIDSITYKRFFSGFQVDYESEITLSGIRDLDAFLKNNIHFTIDKSGVNSLGKQSTPYFYSLTGFTDNKGKPIKAALWIKNNQVSIRKPFLLDKKIIDELLKYRKFKKIRFS